MAAECPFRGIPALDVRACSHAWRPGSAGRVGPRVIVPGSARAHWGLSDLVRCREDLMRPRHRLAADAAAARITACTPVVECAWPAGSVQLRAQAHRQRGAAELLRGNPATAGRPAGRRPARRSVVGASARRRCGDGEGPDAPQPVGVTRAQRGTPALRVYLRPRRDVRTEMRTPVGRGSARR
jgi:hypothetical protein